MKVKVTIVKGSRREREEIDYKILIDFLEALLKKGKVEEILIVLGK